MWDVEARKMTVKEKLIMTVIIALLVSPLIYVQLSACAARSWLCI
jgi:hypothetical protein